MRFLTRYRDRRGRLTFDRLIVSDWHEQSNAKNDTASLKLSFCTTSAFLAKVTDLDLVSASVALSAFHPTVGVHGILPDARLPMSVLSRLIGLPPSVD